MSDVTFCSAALRKVGRAATSMEQAAQEAARWMYRELGDASGQRGCALVRVYKTHPYGSLQPEMQAFARGVFADQTLTPETRCLTLLASAGDEPAWNDRRTSRGHQAIPLPSEQIVAQLPMVANLVGQLGLQVAHVIQPSRGLMVDQDQRTFNVFHVAEASGSAHIPSQDFVRDHRVRSVLGFGGLLPGGDLFAAILFSRQPISRETAELFRPVALSLKLAILPFDGNVVFS